jgi:hypothetical protein
MKEIKLICHCNTKLSKETKENYQGRVVLLKKDKKTILGFGKTLSSAIKVIEKKSINKKDIMFSCFIPELGEMMIGGMIFKKYF